MTIPVSLPILPSGGQLPVSSTEDVLAAYPEHVKGQTDAPVRDAIVEGQTEMFLSYQLRTDYAAAQSDPTRATGTYLDGFANSVGIHRQADEQDEPLRDRLFSIPAIVSPNNIKAAVDAILSQYTTKECALAESVLDRWFVSDGLSTWHSFVGDGTSDMTPYYPDRLYDERSGSSPGGPLAFSNHNGRHFILRVPELTNVSSIGSFVFDGTENNRFLGFFVNDGSGADLDSHGYVFAGGSTADAIYQAIINTVNTIAGHGVRWSMFVDARL